MEEFLFHLEARMHYSHAAIQKHNPFRPSNWRWARACALHATGAKLSSRRDDPLTIRAAKYLRALGSAHCPERPLSRLRGDDVTLHAAHRLHEHGGEIRCEVEARLLARQSSVEIAAALRLDPPAIDAYEALFFCVRGHLAATDWVVTQVIGPGLTCGFGQDLGGLWKAIGYFGGPLALDAVLAATSERHDHARYTPELLGKVQGLVSALMSPPDASFLHGQAQGETGKRNERAPASRIAPARVSLDGVISEISEYAKGRAKANPKTHFSGPARREPELGKKAVCGTTAGAT
jgi:hypothetical protein